MTRAREIEEDMLQEAKKKAEAVIEQAEAKAQKIEDQGIQKMEVIQNRLLAREEKMDEKLEKIEQEKAKLGDRQKDLEAAIQDQVNKLAELAGLSKQDAKQHLMDEIQVEYQADFVAYIEKLKALKKEEGDKEAAMILSKALPRIAVDAVSEFTTKTVDLPNDDYK